MGAETGLYLYRRDQLSGACSYRASTVAGIALCSQRLMRRFFPVVYWGFSAQRVQAEDQ